MCTDRVVLMGDPLIRSARHFTFVSVFCLLQNDFVDNKKNNMHMYLFCYEMNL